MAFTLLCRENKAVLWASLNNKGTHAPDHSSWESFFLIKKNNIRNQFNYFYFGYNFKDDRLWIIGRIIQTTAIMWVFRKKCINWNGSDCIPHNVNVMSNTRFRNFVCLFITFSYFIFKVTVVKRKGTRVRYLNTTLKTLIKWTWH